MDARIAASVSIAGFQSLLSTEKRLCRALWFSGAFGVLVGCDSVIGLRDDYYVTSSNTLGGAENGGETNGGAATAGAGGTNGGTSGSAGGDAGVPDAGEADAGASGAPDVVRCADHPITASASWSASASGSDAKSPPSALTDNTAARWSTGKPQVGSEWLQIDCGSEVSVRRINLQQGTMNANDYPRRYAVSVSDTSQNLTGSAQVSGVGTSGVTTTIVLPRVVAGRYVLIKQLGSSLSWWSVEELEISCFDDQPQ